MNRFADFGSDSSDSNESDEYEPRVKKDPRYRRGGQSFERRRGRIGNWSNAEDDELKKLVEKVGAKKWSEIASHLTFQRNGKQCRERWFNHLQPGVRKEWWTPDEEKLIIESHEKLGNSWSKIGKLLAGRPANSIKNHYNSTLSRIVEDERTRRTRKLLETSKPLPSKRVRVTLKLPVYERTVVRQRKKDRKFRTIHVKIFLYVVDEGMDDPGDHRGDDEYNSSRHQKKKKRKRDIYTEDEELEAYIVPSTPRRIITRSRARAQSFSPTSIGSVSDIESYQDHCIPQQRRRRMYDVDTSDPSKVNKIKFLLNTKDEEPSLETSKRAFRGIFHNKAFRNYLQLHQVKPTVYSPQLNPTTQTMDIMQMTMPEMDNEGEMDKVMYPKKRRKLTDTDEENVEY